MNLQHLKYVAEVERTGSISKAARNLFTSQPNLSKAIRELESEIGLTLFSRTSQGVAPTQRGAEFLAYAKTILSQIDELESIYRPQDPDRVRLNISVPRASYISAAFTAFLNELRNKQEISIGFREVDSLKAIGDVASGASDLAVIRYQQIYEEYFLGFLKEKGLAHEELFAFHPVILCAGDHPLAGMNPIPVHLLYEYPEIVHGDIRIPSVPMHRISYSAEQKVPDKRIYVSERGSQLDMLRLVPGTYMWVSYVPRIILKPHNLVLRDTVPQSLLSKDLLVYSKSHHLSRYEALFVDLVKREYEISSREYKEDSAKNGEGPAL